LHFSTIRSFGMLKHAVCLIFTGAVTFMLYFPAATANEVRLTLKEARFFKA